MHFVILGCGRVGSTIAVNLDSAGHSVSVIDRDSKAFKHLPDSFDGNRVRGIGFDREVLVKAGIEDAVAFAAVSSGDNTNILAARVVREVFGVKSVVARIYDPKRAEVYARLGIPTVATVPWATMQVMRHMLPRPANIEFSDTSGRALLAGVEIHAGWAGISVAELAQATGARVAWVVRAGKAELAWDNTVLQEGDTLHLACPPQDLPAVERALQCQPRDLED